MVKKILCIMMSLLIITSVIALPAMAKEVTTVIFDSNQTSDVIQYGTGSFPEDGAYVQKAGWATDKPEDAYNDGRTSWVSADGKALVFNSSLMEKNSGAAIQHLVDCSQITTDDKITYSFDFTILNNSTSSIYFVAGLDGYKTLPFYSTPRDNYIGVAERGYGSWGSFGTNNTKKLTVNDKYNFSASYTWNATEQMYDMSYTIKQGQNTVMTNIITADLFKYDKDGFLHPNMEASAKTLKSPNIKSIEFDLTYPQAGNDSYDAVDIMKIENIKLTSTKTVEELGEARFSEACLSKPEILIGDQMASQIPVAVKCDSAYDQYANITDTDVLAGKKWLAVDNGSAAEKTFNPVDDWLVIRPFQQKGNLNFRYIQFNRCCPKYVKCFTPITDGSGFTVTSTVIPYKVSLPKYIGPETKSDMPIGFNIQLRLTNDVLNSAGERMKDSTKVFNIFSYGENQEEKALAAVAGVNNASINVNGVNSENYAAKTNLGWDIVLQNKTIVVESKFVPVDDYYNVFVTCKDEKGDILLANTQPVEIPGEMVSEFSRFQISATFDDCVEMTDEQAAIKLMAIKDVVIQKTGTQTELKSGKNTIYLPFAKKSGTYINAAVAAAIYTNGEQTEFAVNEVKNVHDEFGSVPLEVNITDPDNQFVRYFVFESFENLKAVLKGQPILTVEKQ